MIPINTKITMEQRNWLDKRIKAGEFASYGHCMRYLIGYRRKNKRIVANLKTENAQLRERLKMFQEAENGQKAPETVLRPPARAEEAGRLA